MIPAAVNIPLALCSVVIRRFIDSYTGRLPLVIAASAVPSAPTVAFFSGALFCLCHQLRRGTLVKIGMGRRISSLLKNSRHTIQRRVKNNSWFLRNIAACRRKCTEAMFRIARQSDDSLRNIQAETGTLVETNSLPMFTRHAVAENRRKFNLVDEPPLQSLYSNQSFDSLDGSNQDLIPQNSKREIKVSRSKRRSYSHTSNRPVTRNFRKYLPEDTSKDGKARLSPKRRKKSEHIIDESEDNLPSVARSHSEVTKHLPRRQLQRSNESEAEVPSKLVGRRYSERIKKQPKVQKITRKTRSGRVYAYRL